jgi:hypothetical protein
MWNDRSNLRFYRKRSYGRLRREFNYTTGDTGMQEIKDCWVSADGKEIILKPYDFMMHDKTKWREANYEKENARMNKSITPPPRIGKEY